MHRFKELKIWQVSMELAQEVYKLTESFPQEEKFGLTSQIRRAATSIPSNIAEGAGRGTNRDFSRFLDQAIGSCNELQTQLILSGKIGFVSEERVELAEQRILEIKNMTFRFKQTLNQSKTEG
jgi:four helix bundle protein